MSIFERLDVYDDTEHRSAPLNMAIDEALLETVALPSLRFYRWRAPAISFGYFGTFADVAVEHDGREFVRRWTGGGTVPHGDDLTYSVIIPASHVSFAQSSLAIYSAVHRAIRDALEANGIEATLANSVSPKISEDCFANPVRADVISQGRKIAGAAHRRSRLGLLHQGSIQIPNLADQFLDDLAGKLSNRVEFKPISKDLVDRATQIAQSKYATREWLTRR